MDNKHLVRANQLLGNSTLSVLGLEVCLHEASLNHLLLLLSNVELPLLHEDVKGCRVRLFEVDRGFGQFLVNHLGEEVDVAACVRQHPVHKVGVSRSAEEALDVVDLDLNNLRLAVRHFLLRKNLFKNEATYHSDHVLVFVVNGVLFERWVCEGRDELRAPHCKTQVK